MSTKANPAISRLMAQRRRAWKSPEHRSFPYWHKGMTTAMYVREYYRLNDLARSQRGENAFAYPDSYITPIDRAAPFYAPEQDA